MPNMMVLGVGAFGRWLGWKCGAFMNEISALLNRPPTELSSLLSTMWEYKKSAVCKTGTFLPDTDSASFDLGLPGLQNYDKSISIAYKLPRLWCFVIAAQMD